jgi:ATP-dependent DNA helicase RecQ
LASFHSEVWLGYFQHTQHAVSQLLSGDVLLVNGELCLNSNGAVVLKFSKEFLKKMDDMREKGYTPQAAKVNFILYWHEEGSDVEWKIVLPELSFSLRS